MRQEPKLFSSDRGAPQETRDGFHVEPRHAPRARLDDDETPRRRRGGFPWKLTVLFVVLVVLGFSGWKIWSLFSGPMAGSGEVPVFTAAVDPFKHRPDDPGGMSVPNQDVTVYNTLGGAQPGEGMEVLLPEPEEPVEFAAGIPEEEGVLDLEPTAVELGDIAAPEEDAEAIFSPEQIDALVGEAMGGATGGTPVPREKPAPPPAPATTIAVVGDGIGTTTETAPQTGGSSGTLSLDDIAASLGVGGQSAPAPAASSIDTGAATNQQPATQTNTASVDPVLPSAAAGGSSWVQIAAYLSREDAAAAWQRLATAQADLLARVEARVMETSVAGTTFHRLQVGEFASAAEAQRLCDALRQRQIDCMVVGP